MHIDVAVAQVRICWQVAANVTTVLETIGSATTGALVVLPEAALSGYDDTLSGLDRLDPAELRDAYTQVARAAQDRGAHVVCGSLLPEGDHWYNAALYFGPHGDRWTYRKVNLAMHERARLVAGDTLPVLHTDIADIGVQLCREIRFPEQWHWLATQGAQLLAYPTYAANPTEPSGVWRAHLISRAAETQRFVLAANVADPQQHCPTMIVSPRGEVLAESPPGESTVLRLRLDLEQISDHYLGQQRSDVIRVAPSSR